MFPIILDTRNLKVALIGNGPATERRLQLLRATECKPDLFKDAADVRAWDAYDVVFIADFDDAISEQLYNKASQAGALVNVEDKRKWCDFHVPAIVRRGDLLLTVSTNASSPRLARRLKYMLETLFPPAWVARLKTIKAARAKWKKAGLGFKEVADKTDQLLDEKGWLKVSCPCLEYSQQESK